MAILEAVGGRLEPDLLGDGRARAHTVAIAHDYITQRGGAERVVLSLAKAFPGAPILTSLYDAATTYPEFADLPISSAGIDRYDAFRRNHRLALPLLARSFSSMVAHADVVVCSSSGWAHGIQTDGRKIVYCHNPARWLYQADGYELGRSGLGGAGLRVLQRRLREWDGQAARSADRYLVNSSIVRDRVRAAYGIDAEVLHPPHALDPSDPQEPVADVEPGFLLCVSRLMSYKNVDAVVEAMRGIDRQLVVVGSGPDEETLRRVAPSNVIFTGSVTDDQLRWLYAGCSALLSASYEDFGLSPLEAAAFGKPSALLRYGGFLDTLDEGTTGLFFDEPTPIAINATVRSLLESDWDEGTLRRHAEAFSEERFIGRLRDVVTEEAGVGISTELGKPVPSQLVAASSHVLAAAPAVPAWKGLAAKAAVVASDALAIVFAMTVAFRLWAAWRAEASAGLYGTHIALGAISIPIWLAAFARSGLYRRRAVASHMDEFRRVVRGVGIGIVGTAAAGGLLRLPGARLWFVLAAILGVISVSATRLLVRRGFDQRRRAGRFLRPVVLIGSNDEAADLADTLGEDPRLGYQLLGVVSDEEPSFALPHLGPVKDTVSVIRRTGATGVVIATTAVGQTTANLLVRQLSDIGVHVEFSSALRDIAERRLTVRPVGRTPLMHVEPCRNSGWRALAKRGFDVAVASITLLLTTPVILVAALAIKLTSPGPVVFRQRRLGRGGRSFAVLKLRTMVVDAEEQLTDLLDQNEAEWPLFKLRDDPRITPVGRLLRRTSIDELPQLWNVLRGHMSVVGPRPALPDEALQWSPELHARLRFRPGLTGMWQVNGRSDSSFADYHRLDLYYVQNWSLATDLAIVARTVPAVLRTHGAY